MAMNKAELAMLEEARKQAAFRRTMPVERDLPAPKPGEGGMRYTEGWDFNAHTGDAYPCWSTSVSHGNGPAPKAGQRHISGAQRSVNLFTTKVRALRALRWALEEQAASSLRRVDKEIEAALSAESPAGAAALDQS